MDTKHKAGIIKEHDPRLHSKKLAQIGSTATTTTTAETAVTFCGLPIEIHRLICEHIDDVVDLIFMGTTAPYFWGITQEILPRHYAAHLGRWAGEMLVCVGQKVSPGDYPPGLYSAKELESINGDKSFDLDGVVVNANDSVRGLTVGAHEFSSEDVMPDLLTLYNLCLQPNACFEDAVTVAQKSNRAYLQCLKRCNEWRTCIRLFIAKRSEIEDDGSVLVAGDQAWILRNLTTKEFVTAVGIALDEEYINGPFIKGIGFGHVVMSRVLWSTQCCHNWPYSDNIKKGVWAGHRFDITTQERHDKSIKCGEMWKNVSEEVAGEIAAIWRSNYGSSWKEIVFET